MDGLRARGGSKSQGLHTADCIESRLAFIADISPRLRSILPNANGVFLAACLCRCTLAGARGTGHRTHHRV
jgi:hypothetical protein